MLTGRADEPRQIPAPAFGPADLDGLLRVKAVPFRNVRYGSRRPRRGAARKHGGWKGQTPEFAHIHPPNVQPGPPCAAGFLRSTIGHQPLAPSRTIGRASCRENVGTDAF